MRKTGIPLEERFWTLVSITDDCWLWMGSVRKQKNGDHGIFGAYPQLHEIYAHRVSWILENGTIPAGMHVLHACDNPMCVNPSHLFLGTHADNMKDMFSKERRPYSKGKAKITAEDVIDIRQAFLDGTGVPILAEKYSMTKRNMYDIVNGVSWKVFKLDIKQDELLELANKHEPVASGSDPTYRQASCVKCDKPLLRMWHIWLNSGGFKKEIHLCFSCGKPYMINP